MFAIILVIFIIYLLYLYGTRNHDYWAKKGVKHDKTVPFFGNLARHVFSTASLSDIIEESYWRYKDEKLAGQISGFDAVVLVRDPDLVKNVLVTDFHHFYPRGLNPHEDAIEPMLKNLFFADGDLWKLLRQRMTPAFTTGKLKAMFPLIVERAERLQKIASDLEGKEVNARELMARYTTDFIGACGFGIDPDALNDENSQFRKLGKRIFTSTFRDYLRRAMKVVLPSLFKHLYFQDPSIERTTNALVQSILKQRNYKPSNRNDFIDLLLMMKEQGKIVGESIEKVNADGTIPKVELEIDDLLLAAQVFIFFAAGFETSSSATSFTLHQLAFHPEIQEKCQKEIDAVLSRHEGRLCYEAVKQMKYLEMCFREGMRMFPSLGFLIRKCARTYTFPGTNVTIDKGVAVVISLQGMHNDERFFDNPKEFRPERFSDHEVAKHVYLPFGEGPRACIGQRLGLMQSLAGMAALLSRFTVAPSVSTLREPIRDPTTTIVQAIQGGLPLALVARKKGLVFSRKPGNGK